MPRKHSRLAIHKLSGKLPVKPGRYQDGGGLSLRIGKTGKGSWVFRYQLNGKGYELGLGGMSEISLKEARAKAAELRAEREKGNQPTGPKVKHQEPNTDRGQTFEEAAHAYITANEKGWRSLKTYQKWNSTLRNYAFPVLGDMLVSDISHKDVQKAIEPIWHKMPETSDDTLLRIKKVIERCDIDEERDRTNPAARAKVLLPKRAKRKPVHRPSIPWQDMPWFMKKLRTVDSTVARCLEFQVLTGVRPGEARKATAEEIDGDVWIVPEDRSKTGKPLIVPLTKEAQACIGAREGLLFPGLHENSQQNLLYRLGYDGSQATAHGFRSSLRTWCTDNDVSWDIAESLLGHAVGDKSERAYQRSNMLEAKRAVLERWAEYLVGGKTQKAA